MRVVADASPLRYLIGIDEWVVLPTLFGEIVIPSIVEFELSRPRTPAVVREMIASRPSWLQIQHVSDDVVGRVDPALDPGERGALALALQCRADLVLVDDMAGRREALDLGLKFVGTIGILRLAAERGLIHVPDVVERLKRSGFYCKPSFLFESFREWLP